MNTAARLVEILREKLGATRVLVNDESAAHAGHAGAAAEGETHFSVEVVSPVFRGLDRLARHRAVYEALSGELAGGLHALKIRAYTPEEAP